MRRRILSMFLAILLVVAMSLPVFAHAYTEYIDYAGEMVEANARCGGDSYSVSTNTMATGFLVQSMAQVYLAPTVSMPDGIPMKTGGTKSGNGNHPRHVFQMVLRNLRITSVPRA